MVVVLYHVVAEVLNVFICIIATLVVSMIASNFEGSLEAVSFFKRCIIIVSIQSSKFVRRITCITIIIGGIVVCNRCRCECGGGIIT